MLKEIDSFKSVRRSPSSHNPIRTSVKAWLRTAVISLGVGTSIAACYENKNSSLQTETERMKHFGYFDILSFNGRRLNMFFAEESSVDRPFELRFSRDAQEIASLSAVLVAGKINMEVELPPIVEAGDIMNFIINGERSGSGVVLPDIISSI